MFADAPRLTEEQREALRERLARDNTTAIRLREALAKKQGVPFTAAVWLTFPAEVTTEEQAYDYLTANLKSFRPWHFVSNYYGAACLPIQEGVDGQHHPDFA